MGRSFTNLQVHVGSRPPAQVRSAIVDLLDRDARAAGLVAVETPAAATRRALVPQAPAQAALAALAVSVDWRDSPGVPGPCSRCG